MNMPWYTRVNWMGVSFLALLLVGGATGTVWVILGWAMFMGFEIMDLMAEWKRRPTDGYVVLEDYAGTTRLADVTLFLGSREAQESAENEGGWTAGKRYRVATVRTVGQRLWVNH